MGDHALLSASSSHRWLSCPPSARLEEPFENKTSSAAAEGTAAHSLSEHKLREFLKLKTKKPTSKYDSQELEHYTDVYIEYACELIAEAYARSSDPIALIEQRLDFSHYVPEGFGTGDLVIVADGLLDVVDLKYGKGVRVSAEDNPQELQEHPSPQLALAELRRLVKTGKITDEERQELYAEFARVYRDFIARVLPQKEVIN